MKHKRNTDMHIRRVCLVGSNEVNIINGQDLPEETCKIWGMKMDNDKN